MHASKPLQPVSSERRTILVVVFGLLIALLAAIIFASSIGPVSILFSRTGAILLEKVGLQSPVAFTERE